ncbi:MAG: CvpA family protein [Intestinibacter sp.]
MVELRLECGTTIINIGVLIALFLVSRIVLIFIKGLTQLITKLPVIKQFDKLGGIIYGLLEALVIIYVILTILSLVSPLISNSGIIQAIENSFIGSVMYDNNLLLKLIF